MPVTASLQMIAREPVHPAACSNVSHSEPHQEQEIYFCQSRKILCDDGDFGNMPQGTNVALRHGILHSAKQGLSYFCRKILGVNPSCYLSVGRNFTRCTTGIYVLKSLGACYVRSQHRCSAHTGRGGHCSIDARGALVWMHLQCLQ